MIKLIKQCSPSWGNLEVGRSGKNMCQIGCVITALSSLSAWYHNYVSPDKLVKKLKYADAGLLYWQSVDEALPFKFVYRYYKNDDKKIKSIIISPDNACLLQINYGKHWVLLVGYSYISGWRVMDPLYGDIIYLKHRYKGNSKAVVGFAEFTRK